MICVMAPASKDEAKNSAGDREDDGDVGARGALEAPPGGTLMATMLRSIQDLKKKKDDQPAALPRRLGVRPRYSAPRPCSVRTRPLRTETVVSAADGVAALR